MEVLHQMVQILVILAHIKSIKSQCLGESSCTCHCSWTCAADILCTSCEKGWSGTEKNYCQRKNIAYRSTATSTSTYSDTEIQNPPQNAIDENMGTFAVIKSGENSYPRLILTLSEITDINRLYLKLTVDANIYHSVYVTDSSLKTLCGSFFKSKRDNYDINLICYNRSLTGNQIIVEKPKLSGVLYVYEIQIYKCSTGTYGSQCENMCWNCQDNRCDGDTGVCKVGCKSGWYGDKCDKECPSQCQSCDENSRCTSCLDIGYSGPICEPCSVNTYGRDCSLTCQNCLECNHITGCQQCSSGFYGISCSLECGQGCKTANCKKDTGNCVDGCKDGYMGTNCAETCRENCVKCTTDGRCLSCVSGKFGKQCENTCPESCSGSKTCDKISGECLECSSGKFGPNCTEACSSNCLDRVCHRNGDCTEGCSEGWIGSKCDKRCVLPNCEKCSESSNNVVCEICHDGYFLDDQTICQKCPSNCETCENVSKCNQCKPHWKGRQCDEACNENCVDGLCTMDGTCIYGCNNSKYGTGCTTACRDNCVHCFNWYNCTECLPGFFERYCWPCKKNCFNCTNFNTCKSCKAGFYGDSCSEACPKRCQTCESQNKCNSCRKGWTGDLCQCSENCALEECGDGGKCLRGCKDSFYGDYCNISCPFRDCLRCDQSSGICSLCSKGSYGNNCSQKCSTTCVDTACDMEGACLQGCQDDFSGVMCAEKQTGVPRSPVYIYIIAGIAILFIILAVFLFLIKRNLAEKKNKLTQNINNNLTITELIRNENAVYANENIEPVENVGIENQKRSSHNKDNSLYNLRGSQAFLIELDPNEEDEVEVPMQVESDYYNVQITRIPVDKLWEVVQKKRLKGELEKEYESIPNGLLEPCKEALKAQNRSRNRYKKMYPYDATRVILETEAGTDDSDFINACYVHGFDERNEYIATQGPFTPETVYDFWRMIWQQNSGKIVMLTNLVENNVMKCKQYWPDKEGRYGSFLVKMEKEESSASYTIRTIKLSLNGKTKDITQFHFTAWPDKGVPRNVTSIVNFRNNVVNYNVKLNGPMVIHCSAGVGRTGTYMAFDYLIKQAERQGSVEVINCVASMRHQRVHVVQTVEQYIFLHDALVEALTEGNRNVSVAEFPEYYNRLKQRNPSSKTSGIENQYQLINRLSPTVDDKCFQTARLVENRSKNRYENILPSDNYRIFLSSGDNDYINAIQVPSYKSRNAFALTQMPLPNTVLDFWCLVLEQDVSTIVMMNSFKMDKKIGVYWPVDAEEVNFGSIVVSILETAKQNASFDVLKFRVLNTKTNEERLVKQFQCKFWPDDAIVPEKPGPLLEMIEEVENWQRKVNNPTIVVHCMNGAKKSGLFCTVATIIERIRTENEIAVLQTVVQMRSRRSQIVASKEQLMFCYDAVQAYLDMFNTYSN